MSTVTYLLLCIILVYKLSPLNCRNYNKILRREIKDEARRVQEAPYLRMQIMTMKGTTQGML